MGIGAVLLQTYPDGKERPVAYLSKKFTLRPQNWCTIEQEPQKSTKGERWRLKLQQYRYTIDHIRGDDNAMPDYLSRSPVDQGEEDPDDYVQLMSTATQTEDIIVMDTSTPQIVAAVTTRAQANKIQTKAPHVRDEEPGQTKITPKIGLHVPDEETDNKNKQQTTVKIDDNMIIPFTEEDMREQQRSDYHIQHIVTNIKKYNKKFVILDDIPYKKNSSAALPVRTGAHGMPSVTGTGWHRYHQHRDISPTYRQLSNPTSEHQRTSNSIFKHQSSSRSLPKHRHEIQQPQTAKKRALTPTTRKSRKRTKTIRSILSWYNDRHPHTEECQRQKPIHNNDCLCPRTHRPYKAANDQWGLQMAIARTFGQYLDKSSTLANWAVGLDTVLGAYMSPQERERLMQQQVRNYDQTFTDMVLHVQNEEPAVQDQQQQTDNQDEPSPQVLQQDHDSMNLDLVLHVQNEEPLEQTAEEEDNHHYVQGHQQPHLQCKIVIPPRSKIVNISHLQPKVVKQRTQYEQKIKNRKGSHWSRRNRYRWEMIRQVFNDKTQGIGFSTTMVKQILRSMGIRYTNINMVGQTLFIGTTLDRFLYKNLTRNL
ncbi:unnamed protein product [Didymodactylos carnosus]|uniref:Reverse transcriptase RNase H-like domain-containing protein n=1 Tax=Didymodactylos carnosus TaxID=1234261 RepID=A0A815GWJ6_9BILA|nr:unnamed protein product [Didymodactylos carnosus]CAF4207666.1 unnamed protein product [Didymodactylos carnosus]